MILLGGTHELGSFLSSYLIRVRDEVEIVYCSVDGTLPDYVFKKENIYSIDVRNRESLKSILRKGDIVFNGQIALNPLNFENLAAKLNEHKNGLINLLGIANEVGVSKVITYIPYILDYSQDVNPQNYRKQTPTDQNGIIFESVLEVCDCYWKGENFGYHIESDEAEPEASEKSDIDQLIETKEENNEAQTEIEKHKDVNDELIVEQKESTPEELDGEKIQEKSPENENDLQIEDTSEASDLETKSEAASTITPSPVLNEVNTKIKVGVEQEVDERSNIDEKNDNEKTAPVEVLDENKSDEDSEEPEIKEYETKLIVIRAGYIFGPYSSYITEKLCNGVKSQNLLVYGKSEKIQSWVTPESLARAMYLSSNLENSQEIIIKSFDANLFDLISALEKYNISETKIKKAFNFWFALKRSSQKLFGNNNLLNTKDKIFRLMFNKEHLIEIDKDSYKKLKLKIKMKKLIEDSMNWFNQYCL